MLQVGATGIEEEEEEEEVPSFTANSWLNYSCFLASSSLNNLRFKLLIFPSTVSFIST
jgi:hypothetical protein